MSGLIDFGGTLSGLGSLVSAGAQWYSAYKNNKNQEEANSINLDSLNWQKQQWQETKEREDDAIQRRVADLRAAGLSPTLAAGSSASAGTAPTLPQIAPKHYQSGLSAGMNGIVQALRMKQEYDKTQAEIDLIEQQERESEGNLINKLAQSDYYQSQTRGSNLSNAQAEFNNGLLNARWLNEQELFHQRVLDSSQNRKLSESQIERNSFLSNNDEIRRDVWAHDIMTRLGLDTVMNRAKMELMSTQALESQVKTRELEHDLENAERVGVNSRDASPVGKIFRDIVGSDKGSVREKLRAPLEVLKKPLFQKKSEGRTSGTRQKFTSPEKPKSNRIRKGRRHGDNF